MAGEIAPLTPARVWTARAIAAAVDLVQIVAAPLFGAGALAPWDDALDVAAAAALTALVGWHWAFLPSFAAEIVPGLDLVPTWTAAAWLATSRKRRGAAPGRGPGGSDERA